MRKRSALLGITSLSLGLAAPLRAEPPDEHAYDRALPPAEARRLTALMIERSRADGERRDNHYSERQDNMARLRAQLYSAAPDLAIVERLYRRERRLQREDQDRLQRRLDRFMASLGAEDRLNYLKMMFPLPPRITPQPSSEASRPRQ